MVITDHFMQHMQAIVTTSQTARVMAKALWDRFFTHCGFPASILSDQGWYFKSSLVKELHDLGGIKKIHTTPYNPQGKDNVKDSISL